MNKKLGNHCFFFCTPSFHPFLLRKKGFSPAQIFLRQAIHWMIDFSPFCRILGYTCRLILKVNKYYINYLYISHPLMNSLVNKSLMFTLSRTLLMYSTSNSNSSLCMTSSSFLCASISCNLPTSIACWPSC